MARGDGTIEECGASLVSNPDVAVVLVVGGNRWGRGGGMEGVSGQPPPQNHRPAWSPVM